MLLTQGFVVQDAGMVITCTEGRVGGVVPGASRGGVILMTAHANADLVGQDVVAQYKCRYQVTNY